MRYSDAKIHTSKRYRFAENIMFYLLQLISKKIFLWLLSLLAHRYDSVIE